MQPVKYTTSTLTNDANGICVDQTTAGAGSLSLDGALVSGGVATAAEAQIVSIEGTGNNSGVVFTLTGTTADGQSGTENVTGANNGTAKSTGHWKTITAISVDGAITGNVEIGWLNTDTAVTPTVRVNRRQSDFELALFGEVSSGGSMTYSCQFSPSAPRDSYTAGYSNGADWRNVDGLTSVTTTDESNIIVPVECVRFIIESFTSGTLTGTVLQSN